MSGYCELQRGMEDTNGVACKRPQNNDADNKTETQVTINLTLEGLCIIFAIYIQSNEIHNVVTLIKFFIST